MISETYREQNAALHKQMADYGSGSGAKYAEFIRDVMRRTGSATVLDYGCGKGSLRESLGDCVTNYDPAIEEWSALPGPADLVVCTDVLEHVEPIYLDDVLDDLRILAQKAAFIVVSCRPAKRTLPDGRNAHLIVESREWWHDQIAERFTIFSRFNGPDYLMVLCK